MIEFIIRPAQPHDTALIYASWLDGFRRAPLVARLSNGQYYERMHAAIEDMLARSKVLVARPPDWNEGVIGWIVGEQLSEAHVLHAVYVKALYRRRGVASALMDALAPDGERLYSAGRPPFTRILDARGFRHASKSFPFPKDKEKTA